MSSSSSQPPASSRPAIIGNKALVAYAVIIVLGIIAIVHAATSSGYSHRCDELYHSYYAFQRSINFDNGLMTQSDYCRFMGIHVDR